ncbi:MAG: hypothetical protein AAB768_02360 [Patescibacteria group bacterium]
MKLLSQITNPVINPKIGNLDNFPGGFSATSFVLQKFLVNFIKLSFVIASVVFLFMLVWGGIEYISAGGDKERLGNSSKRITHALIGIVILLGSYALFKLINLVFGINILKLDIPVI